MVYHGRSEVNSTGMCLGPRSCVANNTDADTLVSKKEIDFFLVFTCDRILENAERFKRNHALLIPCSSDKGIRNEFCK